MWKRLLLTALALTTALVKSQQHIRGRQLLTIDDPKTIEYKGVIRVQEDEQTLQQQIIKSSIIQNPLELPAKDTSSITSSDQYWWKPFLNDVSVIYQPYEQTHKGRWDWCDPSSPPNPTTVSGESNDTASSGMVGDSETPTGMFLTKVPKTGSSTLAGVSLQIAETVAQKKGSKEPCPSHVHHGDAYLTREKDKSFLWTGIRKPDSQGISFYFYFTLQAFKYCLPSGEEVNSKGTYDSAQFIRVLECMKNNEFEYVSSGMEIQNPLKLSSPHSRGISQSQTEDLIKVASVLQNYDFIALTERMDESLVAMKLLNGFPDESIIVASSKVRGQSICIGSKLQDSYTTEDVNEYLVTHFWKDNIDFLLYAAANESLDKTIDFLGRERVEREVKRHQRLSEQALEICAEEIVVPCPNSKKKATTYFGDWAPGHECIMNAVRKLIN